MKQLNAKKRRQCQQLLLEWFQQNARDLPWRKTREPYSVWISEIMLQQTQVKKVVPYYLRFLQQFPDIAALANATTDQVLKVWEGMGYYARARNLCRAARQVMTEYDGIFPCEFNSVEKLAGIGSYTAAAILSIAYNQPYAVLDGNVIRILCRISTWPGNPSTQESKRKLRQMAQEMFVPEKAGVFNEAMMELGATICVPAKPKCNECPISRCCQAFKQNTQSFYPIRAHKKIRPHHHIAAALIWHQNKLLIARRPEWGLLGGLWEFPGGKQEDGESLQETAAREATEELGIVINVKELFTVVKHQYTHFTITLHVFNSEYIDGNPQPLGCIDYRWVEVNELSRFAFPRANGKVIEKLTSL